MPARAPYIPRKQAGFDKWSATFARHVAEDPKRYALTRRDAARMTAAVAKWHAAFAPVACKNTRTHAGVKAKDETQRAALGTLRSYAQRITHAAEVSPADKSVLGVNPGRAKWTRIAVPASHPCVQVKNAVNLRVTLRYFDSLPVEHAAAKPLAREFDGPQAACSKARQGATILSPAWQIP